MRATQLAPRIGLRTRRLGQGLFLTLVSAAAAATAGCNPGSVSSGPERPPLEQPTAPGKNDQQSCVDADGDGFGAFCGAGNDCNDADPAHHDSCPPPQTTVTANPLDPASPGSSGIKGDGAGGITIDSSTTPTAQASIIWVANSGDGTVSKIDTRTLVELARYRTGPATHSPDPSRTTVGLDGDVVVANRSGYSATRIASDITRCVDKNGNGTIETSTGKTDIKAWGSDECVLWNTAFPVGSYPRAAAFDAERNPVTGGSSTVWIGLYMLKQMKQLDAQTGAVLATVDVSPVYPYGAAIDKDGNVWARGGGLVKIDKTTHQVTHHSELGCGYGLAIDPQGRIWTAGGSCVARFDPATNQRSTLTVGSSLRGVALDAAGSAWVADTSFGVHQIDANALTLTHSVPIAGGSTIGMAVDFDGFPWVISQGSSKAHKIDPATYAVQAVATGAGPYTYSDMTGFQLRNASGERSGIYRHVFAGCSPTTTFASLAWTASLPAGTSLSFRARTAADAAGLASATWTDVGQDPGTATPIDLAAKLGAASVAGVIEIEVVLHASDPVTLPVLQSLSVNMSCVGGIL